MSHPDWPKARVKLVEGTEVLRTGGGTTLTPGECNAVLDEVAELRRNLDILMREASRFTNRA